MGFPRSRLWTRQPHSVRVDSTHPIGRRIVYATTVAGGCFDLVKNRFPSSVSSSSPTISVGVKGMAGEFVPASSQYYSISTATNLVPGFPLTVACWARIDSITAGGVLYSLNGAGYSAIFGLLASKFYINYESAASMGVTATSADLGWHHFVVVHRSGTFSLYVDGVERTQLNISDSWSQPAAGNHSIGNRLNGYSSQYFDGAIQDLIVINGGLTRAEAKSLYQNHWQVFKPLPNRWLNAVASGVTTYTVTAQAGSYSISGQSVTVLKNKLLTAQVGSYIVSGQNAILLRHRNLNSQAGEYAVSGQAVSILRHRNITASTGNYTLAGQSVGITYTSLIPAYSMQCLSGSYNLTGRSAAILKYRLITAQAGGYILYGQTANINKYSVGTGSLTKYVNVLTGELLILKQLGV